MSLSNNESANQARESEESLPKQPTSQEAEPLGILGCITLLVFAALIITIGTMILNIFFDINFFGGPAYKVLAAPALALFILSFILLYFFGRQSEKEEAKTKDMQLALTRVRQENTRRVSQAHMEHIRRELLHASLTESKRFKDAVETLPLLEEKAQATNLEIAKIRVEEIKNAADRVLARYDAFRDKTNRFLDQKKLRYSAVSYFQKELEDKLKHLRDAEDKLASMTTAVEDSLDKILRRQDRAEVSSEFGSGGDEQDAAWLDQMKEDMDRMQNDLEITAKVIDKVFTEG